MDTELGHGGLTSYLNGFPGLGFAPIGRTAEEGYSEIAQGMGG
jgi:hypothetical protein